MGFMDILAQYAGAANDAPAVPVGTHDDHSTVATRAPAGVVGGGIAQALRSGVGGSFAQTIETLFENSDPAQRAGLLKQLVQAVEPAVLSSVAGGALGHLAQPGAAVQPADATAVTPAQAGALATAARDGDPGIVDRVGAFYSQHPMVVKALGAAALAIAMNHMSKHA